MRVSSPFLSLQAFQLNKPLFAAKVAKPKESIDIIDLLLLTSGEKGKKFMGKYNLRVGNVIVTDPEKVKTAIAIASKMPLIADADWDAVRAKMVELYGTEQ